MDKPALLRMHSLVSQWYDTLHWDTPEGEAVRETLKLIEKTVNALGGPIELPPVQRFDAPENKTMEAMIKNLGGLILASVPREMGFTAILWTAGVAQAMFYISSVSGDDTVRMLREFVAQASKRGPDAQGTIKL